MLHQFTRTEYLDYRKEHGNNDSQWWPNFISHLKSSLFHKEDYNEAIVYTRSVEFLLFRENIGNQP
ncbi:hypothetical protein [Runella zeae]|uniref:hypothetical protein n=1 Tax=Runella zeae TaxID=94255 RepID=UPI0012F720DE|nr:hypothetical protein [Runella zeae]